MSLRSGSRIGPYEISGLLGVGGMGEVYRARDAKLNRDVALKVLPEAFAQDTERMARFEREAQVLASLNHPGIAAIYGLEESGGARALVMELVEGPTLADRIAQRAIPILDALPIAKQIAEALEYAHEKGIIHRDLKPANVKITADGRVKLLDFGLAKALEEPIGSGQSGVGGLTQSPTITALGTRTGVILGTAQYMSPEQARGKTVDRRADIWAFGVVLVEMLLGRPLFAGETISDTLAAVLTKEFDRGVLPHATPPAVRRMIDRCLERDPKRRLRDIGEARIAIEEADAKHPEVGSAAGTLEPLQQHLWRRALPWALAGALAVAAGVLGIGRWASEALQNKTLMRLSVPVTEKTLELAAFPNLTISPDGTKIIYSAQKDGVRMLYLRSLDQMGASAMPGTEDSSTPFFSPDGEWLGFFADSKLKKVDLRGGPPMALAELTGVPRGASWGADGFIYFPQNATGGIVRVAAGGGKPAAVTQLNEAERERTHRWPFVLPNGKALLFTVGKLDSPDYYDNARIDAVRLDTGERRTVLQGASMASYARGGYLLYGRSRTLFAVPFDLQRLAVTGTPMVAAEGVDGDATSGAVHYAVSSEGSLIYVPGQAQATSYILARMDRSGRVTPLPAPQRNYLELSLSPDGQRAAVAVGEMNGQDIWVFDISRGTLNRLTFGGANRTPHWSSDGRRVAYMGLDPGGTAGLYWKAADGSGDPHLVREIRATRGGLRPFLDDWSDDGKWFSVMIGGNFTGTSARAIGVMAADGAEDPRKMLDSEFAEQRSAFSPDGHWLAYESNEFGRFQVYVIAFPGPGGKWQVSTTAGEAPRWSRNSREIFFHFGNRMMVAPVDTSATFQAGAPQVLFDNFFDPRTDTGAVYDVAPDGKWFIAIRPANEQGQSRQLNLVLNWPEGLRRRVPSAGE